MLFLAALIMAPTPYDREIEVLLQRRDERKAAEAMQRPVTGAAPEADDAATLAAIIPPAIAQRLATCLAEANQSPEAGIAAAQDWARENGGAYAAQCHGYALGKAERWKEAADAFESGGAIAGLDAVTRARLWSQAGNAALIGGDAARAGRALDQALAQPLPRTLATGEIHLDRARARVATGDMPGARADLDQAVVLASADPLAWLLSATLARRMDDLPLARAHIGEAARRAPSDAPIALEQGIIYALGGDRDAAARAAFQRARELAPPDSDIAKQAADYLAQLGDAVAPAAETKRDIGR
jgi:Tfp pilus assembly protein PilF